MREMEIPQFKYKLQISDLENLYKTRLRQKDDLRAAQAIPLLGYMGWPNDSTARNQAVKMLRSWSSQSETSPMPRRLKLIQQHWASVADIVHNHYDLSHGGHQERRGGSSTNKSVFLVSKIAKSKGTGQSNLWKIWEIYKDIAHLATAVIVVCYDLKIRREGGTLPLHPQQLLPLRVILAVPELILAVGMELERYGLNYVPKGQDESMFDPETLWRIPADINVAPRKPPVRTVPRKTIAILNARRAGNRGRANRNKTTPVLG